MTKALRKKRTADCGAPRISVAVVLVAVLSGIFISPDLTESGVKLPKVLALVGPRGRGVPTSGGPGEMGLTLGGWQAGVSPAARPERQRSD